jgi:hypothetical protein
MRSIISFAAITFILICTACSSSTKSFDVDTSGVSTYNFQNPAESIGLQTRIIELMDKKGYRLAPNDSNGLVFIFAADNNAFGTGRGVVVTLNGRPVMSSESSNAGFGTAMFAGSERARMETQVVGAIEKNIPDASP